MNREMMLALVAIGLIVAGYAGMAVIIVMASMAPAFWLGMAPTIAKTITDIVKVVRKK